MQEGALPGTPDESSDAELGGQPVLLRKIRPRYEQPEEPEVVQPQRKVSSQKPAAAKAASRHTEETAASPKRYTPPPNWLRGLHSILLHLQGCIA